MKRFPLQVVFALVLLVGLALAAEDSKDPVKTALQELNEFIGEWNGSGAPDKPRPETKETWTEKLSWRWRFKGDDAWLTLSVQNGKHLKGGELRYLPAKKRYQLAALAKDDAKLVFEGEIRKGYLVLERVDPATKVTQQIRMNTAGDGVRFVYRVAHKPEGRTLYIPDYQVACTKEGEALAAKAKKVECVVSGGLGAIPVNFQGVTYYVCCSGCRDAFNENPAKYVKEFEARKARR